jgi:cytochrome c biogenesis protein CcdA/thiol-disulfide isomerase/thioredoxin
MILFLLSLLAGVLTVLAPCTISLLPVIVGGSLSGERSIKKALIITASLGISVILFTLILKASTALINIPQSFWQILSGAIIIALGITTIFPSLYDRLPLLNILNRKSNKLLATGYQKDSFWGDVVMGAALGPVFSSCSPTYFLILATVLPRSFALGFVYLFAYAIGLCGALLIVTIAGQKLLELFGVASNPSGWFKRSIGVLFLLVGIAILLGYDKKLELALASNIFDVTKIEQSLLQSQKPNEPVTPLLLDKDANASPQAMSDTAGTDTATTSMAQKPAVRAQTSQARMLMKSIMYQKAPEITNPSGFVNTDNKPITLGEFRGKKVVLVDFWTYSCINCQRTLPYVKAWYDKYRDQGLEIVSIHTPEFAFEHVLGNVQQAVKDDGVKYPVVLDNDYGTWNAFGNQYWPRKYLIDIDGYIVYDHAGEGNYSDTETAIQKALTERATVLDTKETASGISVPENIISTDFSKVMSRETYFGFARNEYLANGVRGTAGDQTLSTPQDISANNLYLGGTWKFSSEYAESQTKATITYKFQSKDVYFVASSASGVKVTVLIDGKPVGTGAGADVATDGTVVIKANRLYKLVHMSEYGEHTLQLEVEGAGLDAYTFTFG